MFPCRCDRALGAATSNQVHQRHGHQAGPGAVAEAQLWPLWCHFLVGQSAAGAREAAADRAVHEHPRHQSQHQETKGSYRQIIKYIPGAISSYLAKNVFVKKKKNLFFSWNKKKNIFFSSKSSFSKQKYYFLQKCPIQHSLFSYVKKVCKNFIFLCVK